MIETPERPLYRINQADGTIDIDWEAVNYDYRSRGLERAYRDGWARIFAVTE